jgi:hypothetical protein
MASQTFLASGTLDLTGKSNVVITELRSFGGPGDNSPAAHPGFDGIGSAAGGGGGCLTNVPIPEGDIIAYGPILVIELGDQINNASITLSGNGVTVNPGEPGSSCGAPSDFAEGGHLINDDLGWVTDPSMASRGGIGDPTDVEDVWGRGGGAGARSDGNDANAGNGQIGGVGADGGGSGGNGGNVGQNGQPGVFPSGGGGGGGFGTTNGGAGAAGRAIISWDDPAGGSASVVAVLSAWRVWQ